LSFARLSDEDGASVEDNRAPLASDATNDESSSIGDDWV
jgi:hypothetical protein